MANCEWCGVFDANTSSWRQLDAPYETAVQPAPTAFKYQGAWWVGRCTLCSCYGDLQKNLRWPDQAADGRSYYHHKAVELFRKACNVAWEKAVREWGFPRDREVRLTTPPPHLWRPDGTRCPRGQSPRRGASRSPSRARRSGTSSAQAPQGGQARTAPQPGAPRPAGPPSAPPPSGLLRTPVVPPYQTKKLYEAAAQVTAAAEGQPRGATPCSTPAPTAVQHEAVQPDPLERLQKAASYPPQDVRYANYQPDPQSAVQQPNPWQSYRPQFTEPEGGRPAAAAPTPAVYPPAAGSPLEQTSAEVAPTPMAVDPPSPQMETPMVLDPPGADSKEPPVQSGPLRVKAPPAVRSAPAVKPAVPPPPTTPRSQLPLDEEEAVNQAKAAALLATASAQAVATARSLGLEAVPPPRDPLVFFQGGPSAAPSMAYAPEPRLLASAPSSQGFQDPASISQGSLLSWASVQTAGFSYQKIDVRHVETRLPETPQEHQ